MKIWKLLPAVILAAGAAAVPAVASASPAATPKPPPGVTVSGAIRYMPSIGASIPKTDLPDVAVAHAHADIASATLFSGNWAGYVDLPKGSHTFTEIATSFVIPRQTAAEESQCVTAAGEDSFGTSYAYYWGGLDGWSDDTVEQEGTATYCEDNGTIGNFAWYEMYPAAPVTFTGVNPGDHIIVTTVYTGGKYGLYVHDTTNGGRFNAVLACSANGGTACDRNSAEIITEDPGGGPVGGVYLANYGAVSYSGTLAQGSGISGPISKTADWSGWRIDEEYGTTIMQTTRDLNSAGNGFTDDFDAAS